MLEESSKLLLERSTRECSKAGSYELSKLTTIPTSTKLLESISTIILTTSSKEGRLGHNY